MPIVGSIREVDALCTVYLRRVQMPPDRHEGMDKLTCEISEGLAREALENTDTQEEAERYVLDRIHDIHIQWPTLPGFTHTTKCGGSERHGNS
jgi:hypothetical protein